MNFGGAFMQLDIGQKIRELRRRDRRTQEELAQAIGVTSQAVSRWEANGGYPDMEMIPSIANYFGISIDELFGYHNERSQRIDELVAKIDTMNFQNNGVNINIDECIALARNALIEFPGNEKLMLCLASVLYNAGYVRYGEYHLTDADGYDVLDVEKHRTYAEWKEAISLYEKLLKTIENGALRHRAVCELTQLYLNVGEHTRALELIETAPNIFGCKEFLKANATDGKERAKAYGEGLLQVVYACSWLMVCTVIAYEQNMSPTDKVQSIRGAIDIFRTVCSDGNFGRHHGYVARVYTLLSLYLWLDGKKDEAFEALDNSLTQFRLFEQYCESQDGYYTAPLVCLVPYEKIQAKANDDSHPHTSAGSLAEDWPFWSVPEYEIVKPEIQVDPRWDEWVSKLQ
ncbi:MAG: helix-turn-helix transcriptional regulator [Ruminococcaceae bacterium]|nr:helix-turn-helix transcriptional regulator [Oscillospiraceae bacterium]